MANSVRNRARGLMLAQWADVLAEDSFRRYWLMRLASHGATNALIYSLFVFSVRQSESAVAMGGLLLMLILPAALLGAIAGVAVDRLPRGSILLAANLARALLAIALIEAKDSLLSVYAVAFAMSMVAQFAVPTESAVVPSIARSARLVAANTVINLGTLVSQVVGLLILAPALLKTTNGDPLLLALAGMFGFAGVIVTIIPQFHFAAGASRDVSLRVVRREFAEGWLRVSRDSTAFLALILLVVTSIALLIIATMLPKFSLQVLDIGPENVVFVLAPVGLAIFLGLRSVEVLAERFNKLVTISGAYVLMAGALVGLGFVPAAAGTFVGWDPLGSFSSGPLNEQAARMAVTICFANAFGFAMTIVLTLGRVLLNERIPVEMQGRVFAAQSVLANLAAIVPVMLAGLLADGIGVEPVLVMTGIGALLAAAWSQVRSSRTMSGEAAGGMPG